MASSVRRTLRSSSYLTLLLRSAASFPPRHASLIASSSYHQGYSAPSSINTCAAQIPFLHETRRGFAKGRRQIKFDEEDYDEEERSTTLGPRFDLHAKATALSQMEAAVDALSRELAKLRTGRASPGMLDHIIVETSGVKMPLNRMAVVSVIDSSTLSVTPYDPNTMKELEKAIVSSPLGLNPKAGDQRLIAAIPPLTKEHIQAVCKVVAKSSEDAKQSIRRARQKGNLILTRIVKTKEALCSLEETKPVEHEALDTIKKALPKKKDKDKSGSFFSEDDAKRLEKEIEEITKKFIKSAEDMCKAKEKEITAG